MKSTFRRTVSFSPLHAPTKFEGQKFFLTKNGSKKFHNDNQQQQQQQHTYYRKTGSQQQRYGSFNYSTANLFQHGFKSRKANSVGIEKDLPIDTKIILVKKGFRRSISTKIETFFRSLDESNTEFQTFGHSKRIQNSISFKTFSVNNPFQTNSESRRRRTGETGGKRNVEEGSHQKSSTIKRGFVSNLFLVKKKDGGQRLVINLKQLNAYIPYCHFKMEALQNLKYMLQKGDYMCKLELKYVYFSVPLEKHFLPLVRNFVRVPFPFLWFGTSTTNIHKIAKNANNNLTQDKHQNNNLLRQHAIGWSFFRRDSHEPRHGNLPSATSRICHKLSFWA